MKPMSREHWLLLAGFLGALAMQIGLMGDSWAHAKTPSFVSGVLMQMAILLRAMYSEKPGGLDGRAEDQRRRHALSRESDPTT